MCENEQASEELAMRREARRRKILENSESRLKLIEGGINSFRRKSFTEKVPDESIESNQIDEGKEKSRLAIGKSSIDLEIKSKFDEVVKENEELKKISDYLLENNQVKVEGSEEEEAETEMMRTVQQEKLNSFTILLLKKRLHYVMLAVMVNVFFYFNLGYFFYENIFCPFYTVKAIEFLSSWKEKKDLQPFLFILLAGLPVRIQKSARFILSALISSFSDLLLYIFTFLIGTKILSLHL